MPAVEHRRHISDAIALWMALPEAQKHADLAWAAGLFDGEGCIGNMQSDPRYRQRVTLRVTMNSQPGIERLHRIFPFSPIKRIAARGVRHASLSWTCTHIGYVCYVLAVLHRHLTVKAGEAEVAMNYLGLADPTAEQSKKFAADLRSFKTKPGPWRRAAAGV